jgi:hypothetical protein
MATQTNWNLEALVLPQGDPMAEIEQLKSEAAVIEIRDRDAVLTDLQETVRREDGYSYWSDLECPIKVRNTSRVPPCYGCPEYTADKTDPRMLICRLGRQQVDLLEELDAIQAVEQLDLLLATSYEHDVAACEEMAAALL